MTSTDNILVEKALSLMKQYSDVEKELKAIKVIRSRKIIADYGEWLSEKLFSLKRVNEKNKKGYDCYDPKTEEKYQIKTVRKSKGNNAATWCHKKYIEEKCFDYWVVIRFNDFFEIRELYKVPFLAIKNGTFGFMKSKNSYNLSWDKMKKNGFFIDSKKDLKSRKKKDFVNIVFE